MLHVSGYKIMPTQTPKIIFLGTPDFAVPFLQALVDNKMKPVLVITQKDEPIGRKQELQLPPVKVLATRLCIEVSQPGNKIELEQIIKKYQPEICVLVAFGQIISPEALAVPKFGFVNIHPSLLPKYRGASPVQSVILNNEKITGVTIMKLDEKMDHGPILAQQELEILPDDNNETLHQKLARMGVKLLLETLPKYLSGELYPLPQDDSKATDTKIIKREDGQINWSKSAAEIERQFRAFYPWPGVFTCWGKKRLKIANLSVLEGDFGAKLVPGEVFLGQKNTLAVKCSQGAIVLGKVQLEGKNEVSGGDFLRGYKNIIGQKLGVS